MTSPVTAPRSLPLPPTLPAYRDDPALAAPEATTLKSVTRFESNEHRTLLEGPTLRVEFGLRPEEITSLVSRQEAAGAHAFIDPATLGAELRTSAATAYRAIERAQATASEALGSTVQWGNAEGVLRVVQRVTSHPIWKESVAVPANPLDIKPIGRRDTHYEVGSGMITLDHAPQFERPPHPSDNHGMLGEVAQHEAGHAIHNGFKPETVLSEGSTSPQTRAVAEHMGDLFALLASTSEPALIASVLRETNGNLRQSNRLSRIGDSGVLNADGSRSAVRDLVNADVIESKEPANPYINALVLSSVAYDFLVGTFEADQTRLPTEAKLEAAGATMGRVFVNALKFAPDNGVVGLSDYGRGVLLADLALHAGANLELLGSLLVGRNVLTQAEVDDVRATASAWASSAPVTLPADWSETSTESFISSIRTRFQLDDVPAMRLARAETDAHGLTRIVLKELPPVDVNDPSMKNEIESMKAAAGRQRLEDYLSMGAFTVMLGESGRLLGVFDATSPTLAQPASSAVP